jgi:small GTP-binding protein
MAVKKKVVLLGDSAVGKTSLIRRFVYDTFEDSYITTIGSKVTKKELDIERNGEKKDLTLMIWDILGSEGYTATHARTFAGAHGAILVADLTRSGTLDTLERYWIPLLVEVVDRIPLVFVYNKSDLVKDVAPSMMKLAEMASRHNIGLEDALPAKPSWSFVTSAKTGNNVETTFEILSHLLLSEKMPRDPVKELIESLFSEGVYRKKDKRSLIGVTDTLIVDFCENFGDEALAMTVLRKQFIRAGLDVRNPTSEALSRAVEYLAEAESMSVDETAVRANKERRLRLVEWAKPDAQTKLST